MTIVLVTLFVLAAGGGAYTLINHKAHASAGPIHHQQATNSTATTESAAPASESAPGSEQSQLQQLLAVIRESVSARTLVKTAVPQMGACAITPQTGITQLQQAITDRQNALATLGGLQVSAIPGGQAMRTSLDDVLKLSIAADRDFTAWMQDPQTIQHCPADATQDAHYTAGVQTSTQAMQAKKQFLSQWNSIASRSGLPTFSTLDI
jgi:hypothetical protein